MQKTSLVWEFDIFVAGSQTPKAHLAYDVLKKICCDHLSSSCTINVIDIAKNPQSAVDNQIVVTPTIIRTFPLPKKILVGALSNYERALAKLEIT